MVGGKTVWRNLNVICVANSNEVWTLMLQLALLRLFVLLIGARPYISFVSQVRAICWETIFYLLVELDTIPSSADHQESRTHQQLASFRLRDGMIIISKWRWCTLPPILMIPHLVAHSGSPNSGSTQLGGSTK